jgi:glycosyltransferase involved in cell wall biosynthesis
LSLSKPKILFLIDGLQTGGAERSLLDLCRRFEGFNPIVVVLSKSLELKPQFEHYGIQVIVFPVPRNYRFRRNAAKLIPIVRQINPAIIHSFLFHADMTLRYLNYDGIKITGLVSNSYSARRLDNLTWRVAMKVKLLKVWDRITLSKIDFFIANSEVIKAAYVKDFSMAEDKIEVINRGRDISKFQSKSQDNAHQIQQKFISVGRLIKSKGYDDLIQSFSFLVREYMNAFLVICGEGPHRLHLENLIAELDLSSKVMLTGSIDDVSIRLQESNYFVFPTYYEGLPGSLIEAMMTKIPIICSDIPENKECLKERMCLFHEVGNQTDLLAKMREAVELDDWDTRTQRAYNYAVAHFEIRKIARQYDEMYLSLIGTKRSENQI